MELLLNFQNLIDLINANHSDFINLNQIGIPKNIEFIHYYNNVVVFKKKVLRNFPLILEIEGLTLNKDKKGLKFLN